MEHIQGQPGGKKRFYGQLQEGMQVFASNGQRVGFIDHIHYGDDVEDENVNLKPQSDEAGRAKGDTGLGEVLQGVFVEPGELDEEMRENLQRAGFIRVRGVNGNLKPKYIELDRITNVQNNIVRVRGT